MEGSGRKNPRESGSSSSSEKSGGSSTGGRGPQGRGQRRQIWVPLDSQAAGQSERRQQPSSVSSQPTTTKNTETVPPPAAAESTYTSPSVRLQQSSMLRSPAARSTPVVLPSPEISKMRSVTSPITGPGFVSSPHPSSKLQFTATSTPAVLPSHAPTTTSSGEFSESSSSHGRVRERCGPRQVWRACTPGSDSAESAAKSSPVEVSSGEAKKKRKFKGSKKVESPPAPPIHIPNTGPGSNSSEVTQFEVLNFLKENNSENSKFYQSQIDSRVLVINFDHLIAVNPDLAFTLCSSDQDWRDVMLTGAAIEFFESKGVPATNAKVHIMNMPESMAYAEDVFNANTLVKQDTIFRGSEEVNLATLQGRFLYHLIVSGVLEELLLGKSWRGGLSLEDLVIARYVGGKTKLLITKKPDVKQSASNEDKALDVSSIWSILEVFFTLEGGALPLFFEELKEDILTVTPDEIGQDWFIEYLRFHVAFASSMARRVLLIETFHVARKFGIYDNPMYKDFFAEKPMDNDWRDTAVAHEAFLTIYDSRARIGTRKAQAKRKKNLQQQVKDNSQEGQTANQSEGSEKGQQQQGKENSQEGKAASQSEVSEQSEKVNEKGMQQGSKNSQESGEDLGYSQETATGQSKTATGYTKVEIAGNIVGEQIVAESEGVGLAGVKDKGPAQGLDGKVVAYFDTRQSLLIYKRNSLQHIDEEVILDDLDEVEYYTAKYFHKFLPKLIKGLLRINQMGGELRHVWSLYKAASRDGMDML